MLVDTNKNIFGLDISERALRLVQFKKKGKKIVLSSYNDIIVPPEIISQGEIKQEKKLAELIKKLIKSVKGNKINGKNVVSVLPETRTFIKLIEIISPRDKKNEPGLAPLIQEEIKNHIPLSLDEIYLDWQVLDQTSEKTQLLIGAAPKNIVDAYLSVLENSDLTPVALEIEAAAITRSLVTKGDNKAKIIIDFGAIRTGLIIYDHETVPLTVSLPVSGNKVTETIAKTLKLDWQKAEKAKVVCGLDPAKCDGALLKILMGSINNLIDQIEKAMVFYKSNFSNSNPISEIILCGGGANFSKIDQVLKEKLNLPVKIGNPFTNANQTKKLRIPGDQNLSYTTAIGLALRPFQKKN